MLGIVISTRQRVFGLDLLRAFAIFCVVHRHGMHLIRGTRLGWFSHIPVPHGVDLFFVLSGFLIGLSVMKMMSQPPLWQQTWRFYRKTALRILPNYYAMLLLNLLAVWLGLITADLSATPMYQFVTLTQNIFTPFQGFYWESWSLPVQWWFYIFFPLIVIGLRNIVGRYALPVAAIIAIVACTLYRAKVGLGLDDPYHYDIIIRKTLATRTDCIYVGVLAAWLCRECPKLWQKCRWWALAVGIALFIADRSISYTVGDAYSVLLLPLINSVACALTLPALNSWKTARGLVAKGIMLLSLLSYSMFMVNLLVGSIVDGSMHTFATTHGEAAYLLFWLMVVAATFTLYYSVERPAMRLREKLKQQTQSE